MQQPHLRLLSYVNVKGTALAAISPDIPEACNEEGQRRLRHQWRMRASHQNQHTLITRLPEGVGTDAHHAAACDCMQSG